jgi:hypothetical protein
LKAGDVVTLGIDGPGEQRQKVVKRKQRRPSCPRLSRASSTFFFSLSKRSRKRYASGSVAIG